MKKLSVILAIIMLITVIPFGNFTVWGAEVCTHAVNGGYIYYSVENNEVTITDCDNTVSGEIIIPSELGGFPVTCIGNEAFYLCEKITSAVIPNTVQSIGWCAFMDCMYLKSVFIPDSVTEIGVAAFSWCQSLSVVNLPKKLTKISNNLFDGCHSLESITIPEGVESIGYSAFMSSGIWSVTIPDSVTYIGENAFAYSTLDAVTLSKNIKQIGKDAFYETNYEYNADNWVNNVLYIGNALIKAKTTLSGRYSIKSGTKVIADYAFSECNKLTAVTIPNTVTDIGNSAFSKCTKLAAVVIPDSVTDVGERTFYYCHSVKSVSIGSGITAISESMFFDCNTLASIVIPKNVRSIGVGAFEYCSMLETITIHDGVEKIGGFSFYDTKYYNNQDNWINDVLYIGNHLIDAKNTLSGEYKVKAKTVTIADKAFYDAYKLRTIIIPDSVKNIGYYVFDMFGNQFKTVLYGGTEKQWNEINIDMYNTSLLNAEIIFEYKIENISGDINDDGVVNSSDIILMKKAILNNSNMDEIEIYDINKDGKINIVDLICGKKIVSKSI